MVSCEKVINLKLGTDEFPAFEAYVDLGQILCKLNRKGAFRQGMQYAIESIRIQSYGVSGNKEVQIHRLPDNWVTTNAWVKALAEWNEQQLDESREAGTESMIAKWRDFKVFMNEEHATLGAAANLLPEGYSLTDVSAGTVYYEWDMSEIVVPNVGAPGVTQEYHLHMLGDDIGSSKGVIKAYAESRTRPMGEDPNIVTNTYGGLWTDIEDVGEISDEIIENVSRRNNNPPYPLSENNANENYPGGVHVGENLKGHTEAIVPISDGFRSVIPGFVAPLGLLRVSTTHDSGITSIQIRMAASEKNSGVLSQSMKVAN